MSQFHFLHSMIETNTSFQSLIKWYIISMQVLPRNLILLSLSVIIVGKRYNFTEKFSESFNTEKVNIKLSVCQFRTTSGLKQLTTVVSGRWASSSGLLAKMGWAAKVVRQCFLSTWVLLSVVRRVEEALLRHHYCYTMVRCRRILSSSKKLDGADRCHCSDFVRAYVFRHFSID